MPGTEPDELDSVNRAAKPSTLSRVRRFLVWFLVLLAVGYVAWDRIEAWRFSNDVAAIGARDEPAHYKDAFPEPATAEQREAAALYERAAAAARERAAEDNHRAGRLDVDKPGGPEISLEDIRATYRGANPAMQLLDRATPLDFGGFPAEGRDRSYEYDMQSLASQACLRADVISTAWDGETAAAAMVPCIRLQRVFHYWLYRSGHGERIAGSLRILFRRTTPSDAALSAMQRAFDTWSDDDPTTRYVLLDRARFIDLSGTPLFPGIVPTIGRVVLHPFAVRSARRVLPTYDPVIAMSREPWPARWRAMDETRRRGGRGGPYRAPGLTVRLLDPYWFAVPFSAFMLRAAATEMASRRLAVTAIAAERYRRAHAGAPPPSLDALVPGFLPRLPEDPYSGRPLVLKPAADGYTIYSLDADRRDDGGILYGFGAAQTKHVGPQSPRDLGIRVPLTPQRH